MTINYTNLLGLAKPVTGTETGQWGDVVNDQITELVEDAVANSSSISVTSGDVTLTTTTGSANQARMSTLIITGSPGVTRNIIAPSQAKTYVVINQSNASVVIKGSATTGVTVGTNQTAQVAWNGSDFVEIGNYVHGNFVVNGNLSVNGDSTLGDGGADTSTVNGLLVAANSNISKAAALTTSAPAFAWIKGATYTDTASSGTIAHAPFNLITAPTLSTSNVTTYTNASTLYISGAPSAAGSATITNAAALFIAGGGANITGSVRSQAAATQDALVIAGRSGGTSSYATTLTPGTLTASNTLTLPIGTTTLAGLATAQTFSATQTFSAAVTMSGTTTNISIGTSQTTGTTTIGGTAQTGTLTFGRSTGAQTLDIGVGATTSSTTKTINLGTAGVSGSITNLNYGSAVSGATVTHTWSSGANSMTLNSSGNLGIGVTPSAWSVPAGKIIEVGTVGNSIWGVGASNMVVGSNIYYASSSYKYANTGSAASAYQQADGVHYWYNAVSGTAGNNISFSQAMTLDSSGNLGIGTSSPTAPLDVSKASFIGGPLISARFNTSNLRMGIGIGNTNGFPFLGVNVNNAANDNGTFDIANWASRIRLDNGVFQVQTSTASGAAGGAITWNTPLYLDSSGNLGLGVTPSAWSGAKGFESGLVGNYFIGSTASTYASIGAGAYYNGTNWIYVRSSPASKYELLNNTHTWYIAASGTAGNTISFTQAMTLDASGNLLVGKTATGFVNSNNWAVEGAAVVQGHASSEVSGSIYTYFIHNTTSIGSISQNGTTAVAYNTTSDYRLKDNQQPLTGSGAFIDALQPKTWEWKTDGSRGVGFIAHEVQEVSPGSVVGTKDAVDEEGKPVMQAMEYGSAEFIANIVAELQSLRARVAQLESKGA